MATGLALLAVVFTTLYISKARSSGQSGKGLVPVLVASRDIAEGTPGSSLGSALVVKKVPRYATVPAYISQRTELDGQVALQQILAGEQLSARAFGPIAESGVRSHIEKRERAVQLAGDLNQVLDGTLQPGDRVDVVATWDVPESCVTCHVARTIVRNAVVLKTSAELGSSPGAGQSNTIPVQLRLTDAQAERVLWMAKNGQWWLVLRPVVKPRNSRQGYDSARSILSAGLKRRGPSR